MGFRSRRLEQILGAPFEQIGAAHVRDLVTNGVSEDYDLDFKRDPYGKSESDKRELCDDVAAMANAAGGLIVIGVDEDKQGVATATPGVVINDALRSAMRQVLASGVVPMPEIDIRLIDDGSGSDHGFYLIAVAPSTDAPHAVRVNDGFRFPRRNGATRRWLAEPEIAAAYRDRFAGSEARTARLIEVEADVLGRLKIDEKVWLVTSLTPERRGDAPISAASARDFDSEFRANSADFLSNSYLRFERTAVGLRRFTAWGSQRQSPEYAYGEFHRDGSGSYATQLDTLGRHEHDTARGPLLADDGLLTRLISGLNLLGMHARDRAAAGGPAIVRVHLQRGIHHGGGMQLGHEQQWDQVGTSLSGIERLHPVTSEIVTVDLDDIAAWIPALLVTARNLADEVASAFGVAELDLVTTEGEIRINHWPQQARARVRSWAEGWDIPIVGHH